MAEVAKGIIDVEINTGSASSELKALLAQINAFQLALNKGNASQAAFSVKYSKALQDAINKTGSFTAETIKLQTAAATLDKTLTKGKTSLGQYFSAKYNKNSAIAAESLALAAERARRLQTQFIATSAAANGFQDALAVRPLAAFSSQAAIAGQKAEIMSAMFKQGTTQLINFGKNVQWAGRQLMVGFTVPLTIFGAVAGKTFMELEKQVVGFKKVYGDLFTTPAELNQNLEAVKDLAKEYTKYGVAVKDTIGLASQAAAAGRQGSELTDAVTQSTRLATLGQMDQNAALETTISLQSAFKLSGKDLADTINFLNMVENQTVVSLQDIAAAIPRVAPVIQGLGGDVKDLTVFLAAMQEGGVGAEEGANALKSGLASLINPTKQATAMLSSMGINLDAIVQTNKGDLMGTVQSFAKALAALDQFSRQQALEQVFGKFQYAKLGALFENISREGSQAQQVIATLGYSTEELAAKADKELKTVEEAFGVQLTGAIERFKLAIAPIGEIFVKLAIPLVNFATKIAEAFNGLSDGQKKFAAIGAVIIGVVVPAVTMLSGLFLNLIGTLSKMTQGVSLFAMGFIKGGPVGAFKALTQSAKYLSLAEIDASMAAQQLAGANEILNATLVEQAITGNAAAAAIGNLTKSYAAMIATQSAAAGIPGFGVATAAGARAKTSQVVVRGVQKRNSGGPIFMSDGTTVPGMGNTDTVPAMLTPGEFVVNKEATKNNLGLLHNINDSKNPQGLNVGGKAKGVQYLSTAGVVRKMINDLMNTKGGFAGLNFQQVLGQSSKRMSIPGNFKVRGVSKRASQLDSMVLPVSSPQEIAAAFAGTTKSRLLETFGISVGILPARLNKLLSSGTHGANAQDVKKFIEIAGADFLEPFRKAYVNSNGPGILDTTKITGSLVEKLGNIKAGEKINDDVFRRLLDESIGDSKTLAHIARMRTDPSNTGMARISSFARNTRKRAESLGIEVPVNERGRVTASAASNALIRTLEHDLSINLGRPVTVTKQLDANRNPVIQATKPVYEVKDRDTGESLLRFKSGDTFSLNSIPAYSESKSYSSYKSTQQEENITGRIQEALKSKDITQEQYNLFTEQGFNLSHMNSGGQVPGMQYFAANNKQRLVQEAYNATSGIRRRVRPGKKERSNQTAVLSRYVEDPKYIRGYPEDVATLEGMLKPLTQTTKATRATVLGSTKNPELPYAQQKRIVAAIKEGRYEDLFGMKLDFKVKAGSYTTERSTDFAHFIGNLGNPTLRDFSHGFLGLEMSKKQIVRMKEAMKSAKSQKLQHGTREYALALSRNGWSPAQGWSPTGHPVQGSDWTFEQVLEYYTRDYNKQKGFLKKQFPDKKVQQLLIEETIGSGVKALDIKKYRASHPEMGKKRTRSGGFGGLNKLIERENELLVGSRKSQITGVASDLKTKLPSLITQSGAQGFNQGNIVPGMGNTDTVPAMLTPGEFVVNKESTKKNYDLLTAINGSQKLNTGGMAGGVQYLADGKLVGKVPGALGFAGFFAGQPIANAAGLDNEMGGLVAGFAAQAVASKIAKKALIKFGYMTEEAATKTGMLTKVLGKVGLTSTKLIPVVGWIVAAGITIKALNDSLVKAQNAGGELAKAMYGSADRVAKMGEAFGKESLKITAARLSASKMAGPISEEAQIASSKYMATDSGKQLLADIQLVKKQGGNAVEALRNQLAQSVIAGVITPEEAKAIAIDIGLAMKDKSISLQTTANLNSLIGPNGENLLKDPIKIAADISPKIDSSSLSSQASQAYNDLNNIQKITAMFKNQDRSGEDWKKQFSLDTIFDKNATAIENEGQARALLNYQFEAGIINITKYSKALDSLQKLSKENIKSSTDAQAKLLGYSSGEALTSAAAGYSSKNNETVQAAGVRTAGMTTKNSNFGSDAQMVFDKQKKSAEEYIKTLGYSEGASKKLTDGLNKLSKVDPGIWSKFMSGELKDINVGLNIVYQNSGMSIDEIAQMNKQLEVIQTIPNIEKIIDLKLGDKSDVKELYDQYLALQKEPNIFKGISIKDQFSETMDQFGIKLEWLNSLPIGEKILLIRNMETFEKYDSLAAAEKATGGGKGKLGYVEAGTRRAQSNAGNAIAQARTQLGLTPPSTNDGSGSGSGGQDLLKMLMERFRLQEMLIDKEAEGYNERVKQLNREIELEQRQVELRQKGLEELAKKEDAVNNAYNLRVEALDKVSESNSRIGEQEKSRISLASALASGDIASAASISSEMQQKSAQYQIEDAKAALEKQRQVDLESLTVSINGKLMTRKGIESEIEQIQDRVYNKGIEIQNIQDTLIGFENRKLEVAKQREIVETRMYLMEQKKAIDALNALKAKNKLTKEDQAALADYKASYNLFARFIGMPTLKKYGGSIAKMANGGVAYKGSRETPPALKMSGGFTVPGTGMTDKVSALLTPGEFVVRKPVADQNRGFLNQLNSQVFPAIGKGISSPTYSMPGQSVTNIPVSNANVVSNSSPMYNSTYNVNVNVSGTNASPDDIANVVMAKLSNQNRGNLRSNRY